MAFQKVLRMAFLAALASAAPAPQQFLELIPTGDGTFRLASNGLATATHLNHAVVSPAVTTRVVTHAAPAVATRVVEQLEEETVEAVAANPNYSFGYSVADAVSGDSKTREESRDGDVVRGSYSVADPDGRVRTVEYTADKDSGFVAKVTYDGADGPVAIPFDAPNRNAAATTTVVSSAASDDAVVLASRANLADNESNADLIRRIVAANPGILRTVSTNEHLIHSTPTVVRSGATHLLHNAAVPSVVRTTDHLVHSTPAVVRSDATHVLHNAAVPSVVRTSAVVPSTVQHIAHGSDFTSGTVIRLANGQLVALA